VAVLNLLAVVTFFKNCSLTVVILVVAFVVVAAAAVTDIQ
jgi:hypothetical protein